MAFTARERRIFGRKRHSKIPTILYLAVPVMLFGTMIELPRAEAEAPLEEIIKTNADYCREWAEGLWRVKGATVEMMEELCSKEGI